MRIYIYGGGEKIVGRSGVGQAIRHQRECLRRAEIETTSRWTKDTAAMHVNTVLPDSVLAALGARLRGRKVVWYGLQGFGYPGPVVPALDQILLQPG